MHHDSHGRQSFLILHSPFSIAHIVSILTVLFIVADRTAGANEGWLTSYDVELNEVQVGNVARIEVHPSSISLSSARSHLRPVVSGYYEDGRVQDLTRIAVFASTNEAVFQVDRRTLRPIGNGSGDLNVSVTDDNGTSHELVIPVQVSQIDSPAPYSFQFDTLPALTKNGCNSGACHGSPSGKGGFRLSLQAYDAKLDQLTLVREALGRRANLVKPKQSLLLLKPTMQVAHGGGLQLRSHDPTYQALYGWIEEGCKIDSREDLHCVRVEVLPPGGRVLKQPAHAQQLVALAHFSDGSVRDVTDLAKFNSSDEQIASVTTDGLVVGHTRGQAAILVRFLEFVETVTLTFVQDIEGFAWDAPPEHNYIDTWVHKKLQQLQYLPSELCTDEEFLRRVYLDLVGSLPSIGETTAFLDDTSADKRSRLIDELLERPEYARFWAFRWGDLLKLNAKKITDVGMHKYYDWLVRSIEDNMPFDQFCRDLLTAEGSTYAHPPANYFRASPGMNDCVETTAQLFMGVRIQCAKCHNHPFERWTQDDYYGMAAFFNRIQQKESKRGGELVVWTHRDGEVKHPRTGQQMKPRLPREGSVDNSLEQKRQQLFADWLTSKDNPFLAKVAVNRIWSNVMGRGIVEPVDDFRDSNPPTNPQLLEALATDFRDNGFDQKHILRTILNSRTYQLSSRTNPLNKDDDKLFSHARVRMLGAEQLLDAICHVTEVPESFPNLPQGTKATQLPGPTPDHEFLKVFGQPQRDTACACERSNESNLSQALQLFNGELIHAKLKNESNRFRKLIAAETSNEDIVKQLYLAALCRTPEDAEMTSAVEYLSKKEDRVAAFEDVCWALMNTNEFLFQH